MNYLIVTSVLLSVGFGFDVQRHLEYDDTLNRLIELVKRDKLHEYFDGEGRQCATSACCSCGLQFRNATYAGIHYLLQHQDESGREQLQVMFDEEVPSQQRYVFCRGYLKDASLREKQLRSVCTVVAEGFYVRHVWIKILRCIMLFLFLLIFLIYISDVLPRSGNESRRDA